MSLRCQFDSDGWLQGPVSITHLMTPNHGTGFGTGRGVVMHTEAGYEAGTVETFMNTAAQVSAFFSIGQSGACHQYLPVGHGYCAWSQMSGNTTFRGIEDEDRTDPSIPLTDAQLTAFAQILEACSAYDGFPLQITDDPGSQGLILHSDGGAAWGDHLSCPGPVRAAQRPQVVALAMAIRSGSAIKPAAPAAPAGDWTQEMIMALPTLQQGSKDPVGGMLMVHRVQVLTAGIGAWNKLGAVTQVPADGNFTTQTTAAVKAVQKFFGLTQDGIVGNATWKHLVAG